MERVALRGKGEGGGATNGAPSASHPRMPDWELAHESRMAYPHATPRRARREPGMLIVLPFFFAVGFGVGYIWPGWDAVRASPENTARWLLGALIALGAIIVTLAVLPTPQAFSGELLTLACILVGALAGSWFKDPAGSRDKLAFIASAGVFLFLAALEYDHKLFGNLAKFGGAGVSVEFSNQSRSGRADDIPVPTPSGTEDFLGSVFPGASRIDYAIGTLASLSSIIQRDDKYVNLFSNDPTHEFHQIDMPKPTRQFLVYACHAIVPFANALRALQDTHRSETSVLVVNPELVSAMRRLYLRARLASEGNNTQRSNNDYSNSDFRIQFEQERESIARELAALGKDSNAAYSGDGFCDTVTNPLRDVRQLHSVSKDLNVFEFPNLETNAKDNIYQFFAYFALTVSLSEFAVGAPESAIHFLDREIEYERKDLIDFFDGRKDTSWNCQGSVETEDCRTAQQFRIQYLRRLIILLRLEFAQSMMMRGVNKVIDVARLKRWDRMVDDYEESLIFYDPERKRRNAFSKAGDSEARPARCTPDDRKIDNVFDPLFANFFFAELSTKNNIIDTVGKDSDIINRHPEYIDKFDIFAHELETFDVDCLVRLKANFRAEDADYIKASILDSVGGYWAAKAENFTASESDNARIRGVNFDSKTKIKALCLAKADYARALDRLVKRNGKTHPMRENDAKYLDFGTLDQDVREDEADVFPFEIQQRLDRVERALDNFPAADVADACK